MTLPTKYPRLLVLALCLGLGATSAAACATTQPQADRIAPPPPPPSAPPAVTAVATVPGIANLRRVPLAAPRPVELSMDLRPGVDDALLVSSDLLSRTSYVRRIDDKGVGNVHVLHKRFAVGALGDLLVSSDGEQLCFERFDGATPKCHAVRADEMVLLGGTTPVLIEARVIRPEKKAKKPKKKKRVVRRRKVPNPTKVRIWVHGLKSDGSKDGEAIDSGLSFAIPLLGMVIVSAVGTDTGARLLWYEFRNPKLERRRKVQRAALLTGRLDSDGKLVAGSRAVVLKGDRAYGHLVGHQRPRLFTDGRRAIYVGRFIDEDKRTSRFEAKRLGPLGPLSAPDNVFAVDPWRLTQRTNIEAEELSVLKRLWALAPRLSVGQRPREAARIAWVGRRSTTPASKQGWFLKDGHLHSASRDTGIARAEVAPFVAKRSRMYWAAMVQSGEGIAGTDDGYVLVNADGKLTRGLTPLDHADKHPLAAPVKIADSWWMLRPSGSGSGATVARIAPDAIEAASLSAFAHADAAALVGGETEGLFLALRNNMLSVWRLAADAKSQLLASYHSPVARGFVATRRPGGGAIITGIAQDGARRVVVAAIDDRGQLLGHHDSPALKPTRLHIHALPAGVWISDGAQVSWHDASAKLEAAMAWPSEDNGAACLDGRASRLSWPSRQAGALDSPAALATAGTCVVSDPVVHNGELRWLGTLVDGIHFGAELVTVPHATPVVTVDTAQAVTPAPAPGANTATLPPATPCPADMVLVKNSYCVDRFEGQLVERLSGVPLSPDYPLVNSLVKITLRRWTAGRWRTGDLHARAMPLPPLLRAPDAKPEHLARSRKDVVPSGYVNSHVAKAACEAAGKRLCTSFEWKIACRGEQDRKFPYGNTYRHGICNVFRYSHPASALHQNPSIGHLDPRLNRVQERGEPMLRRTGETHACASAWGNDAIYDMVGNLDEWVDTTSGSFAGGFYSRGTRKGCGALISGHPRRYLDYSLGIRCCAEPRTSGP